MGPLLAVIVIALAGIFIVGTTTGGLGSIFEILFTFFPYFIALGIGLFILAKIGNFGLGRSNNNKGAAAGLMGALAGAGMSELGDRIFGDEGQRSSNNTPDNSYSSWETPSTGREQNDGQRQTDPSNYEVMLDSPDNDTQSPPTNRSSPPNDDNNLSRGSQNDSMAPNNEIGTLEHELENVVTEIGEEEQRDQDEMNELEQAKQELTTALRELQKHEQMEEFIIAINKEGISNKGSADAKAQVVQKYAQKYLGTNPQLEDIKSELQHLAKIEQLIEDAEKHMEKVGQEEQADLQETQQVEQDLAETFANLDHLLDASKELQHYYGH